MDAGLQSAKETNRKQGRAMAKDITRRAFVAGSMLLATSLSACANNSTAEQNATSQDERSTGSMGSSSTDETATTQTKEDAATTTVPRPSTCGRLSVDGTNLVDEKGNPAQLKGFSTHGVAWFGQFVNEECFAQLSGWGANLARLALYTHENGGWCTDGDHDKLRALLDNGIKYATEADMYVIVDWHVLQDCDPLVYLDQAKEFWRDISASYADAKNVIYEICNEPNGSATWDDVRAYAQEIIPIIRANDPAAPIIVGTPTWSQDIHTAAAAPLDFDNVLYALHFYAATHKDDLRNRLRTTVAGGLPVFVSEYGICDASGNGGIDQASANEWMALLNELNISSACWSLSNKAESASMIASTCEKTAGFEDSDLTTCGTWFKAMLAGETNATAATATDDGTTAAVAAQGIASITSCDGTTCAVTVRQSWEDSGKTVNLYDVAVTNTGSAALSTWSVDLTFDGQITLSDSWCATVTQDGQTLHLQPADYNAAIEPGACVNNVGLIVKLG